VDAASLECGEVVRAARHAGGGGHPEGFCIKRSWFGSAPPETANETGRHDEARASFGCSQHVKARGGA
jgi:hypothetical protein